MARYVFRLAVLLAALLGVTQAAHAQEASLTGIITDSTGAVLPGVTITATNEASGNTFTAVTDARGGYVLGVRVGSYKLTVELAGFGTVTKTGISLLVGQESVVNLTMSLQGVQEAVTVTGESPLVNLTQSKLGGNIDPRQVSELPLNGRDWRNLTMMAPGARANASGEGEPVDRGKGSYQINLDGQQVTSTLVHGSTQGSVSARFSRDAIAEFEVISNRFDATQGRSSGIQVNAITKSGTNRKAGSLGGYFRDDSLNSKDFIQKRVLPYQDQQISGTFGGPIVQDKVHFFGNWEFEREPATLTSNSIYPKFNIDYTGIRKEHKAGVRTDYQLGPSSHLNVRWNIWRNAAPYSPRYAPSATVAGTRAVATNQGADQVFGSFTRSFGTRGVNELKGGYHRVTLTLEPYTKNPKSLDTWMPGIGAPMYSFGALYSIGTPTNTPQYNHENKTQVTDIYSLTIDAKGRHAMRIGGDYTYWYNSLYFCNVCNGNLRLSTVPSNADAFQAMFPDFNDATTWNVAPLSPLSVTWSQGFGNMNIISPRQVFAAFMQDDWSLSPRLTLNLGLRYDFYHNCCANDVTLAPFLDGKRPDQKNMIQPRLGFAWSLTDRTVFRGGGGLYFGEVSNQVDHWARAYAQQAQVSIPYDGRADFASNPWNGAPPTYEQALSFLCRINQKPGCLQSDLRAQVVAPNFRVQYSYQSSVGFQQQLGNTMSVEADYAYTAGRNEALSGPNMNLNYNPATGANYPVTDRARLPYPDYAFVAMTFGKDWSNLHSIQTALTKRMSNRWQASATYTLSWLYDGTPEPLNLDGTPKVTFALAADQGRQYGLAASDQRHRVFFNGILDAGLGFQLSGSYLYGSGQRQVTTWGTNLRADGGTDGRLRPDGTIVPRNNFVGRPVHRADMRLQRRFKFGEHMTADAIAELFNVFNHANFGDYVTQERSTLYGQPTNTNPNVAWQSRSAQFGFRLAF